jgi:PAS domain S-box-containing protein
LLTDLLEKEGYLVRPADKPQMAIDSAILKPPGLILLDVDIPGMDGIELCKTLKRDKRTQHIPIILIISLNDVEARIRGFEAGGSDFISKPFQELEVLARVRTHMQLNEMQQNLEKLIDQRSIKLTESKVSLDQTIEALKESEKRLRLIFENTNEVIVISQDEKIKFCNAQIEDLIGYSTEEIHSKNFSEFIHPDDIKIVMREYQTRLSGDQPKNRYSVRFLTKDGQEKYVLISSTLVNWDGAPAALAMISDISMQKKIESDLRKSEERFRQLMEQSPWPTVILSPDGKIILVNSAFNKLWNLSDEEEAEVIAKYNILTDPQYEKLGLMEMVKKAFEGKHTILPPIQYDNSQTADDFNLELLNDFKSPWIQLHLNSVKDEKGQIAYIVSTYMDLTDLKNAEQKIQEQRDLLARMSRANEMGQLTASMNWDLEEIKEILAEIIGDTKRAGEVIRNLRELYRDQKVEFLPIEMNTILNEITKLLHSEFVMQHVVLQTKYGSSLPMIGGNKIQIQQVMVNLIMNGIQAMIGMDSGERKILITSSSDANEVKVFVADRGKGINPDIIDRIFEPLATWKPGGTGMGLAISNSIIKAHGGRMMAENRREGGARVGFALPVIKEDL